MSKFEEVLEKLEAASKELAAKPKATPSSKGVMPKHTGSPVLEQMFEAIAPSTNKPSMASVVAADPTAQLKVQHDNSLMHIVMPPAKDEDWLVQVYPDEANVLHYQAKSVESTAYYTRWYEKVSDEVYDAVKVAYETSNDYRYSFYSGSTKSYLICKRVGKAEIDIPGYGKVEVPELFNMKNAV